MKVLAIETSCDDTSCAVVVQWEDWSIHSKSMVSAHQENIHTSYGGVVPELASRAHLDRIISVLHRLALDYVESEDIQKLMKSIDKIAVTTTPWLPWSLIVWKTCAIALACFYDKKIDFINHLHGHIFSWMLDREYRQYRQVLVFSLSGGHSHVHLVRGSSGCSDAVSLWDFDIEHLAKTRDDAVWEVFDKVSRLLWWPYPWGAWIEQQASLYDEKVFTWLYPWFIEKSLFRPIELKDTFDFSFSWMKSQAHRMINNLREFLDLWDDDVLPAMCVAFVCHKFQENIAQTLLVRLDQFIEQYPNLQQIALVWWVSANVFLRSTFEKYLHDHNTITWDSLKFVRPLSFEYCTDNAAMIWAVSLISSS